MKAQLSSIWNASLKLLKESVSETSYEHWIEPLKPLGIHEGMLYIKMPTEVHLEIIKSMHLNNIREAVNAVAESAKTDK